MGVNEFLYQTAHHLMLGKVCRVLNFVYLIILSRTCAGLYTAESDSCSMAAARQENSTLRQSWCNILLAF
jgi:hypothetical protein